MADPAHYGDILGPAPPTAPSGKISPVPTSPSTPMTRTVAIIKSHALRHRFDIEKRIQEASFEIVKERQMEFDTETDPETLEELFGVDAASLAEGPVWVYVLERRRAVEVWMTLMGDADPDVARRETPNSLRALYGITYEQNGLMGSPDNHSAEIQIASLFVSSPPFHTHELPNSTGSVDSRVTSISQSTYEALRKATAGIGSGGYGAGYARSDTTSTVNGSSHGKGPRLSNGNGAVPFRARPIPASIDKPDIVPKTTRSAALRAGIAVEKKDTSARTPLSKERLAETFANVPGHKRSTTITVASTAAPTIAPRMSRAASLRLGQPVTPSSPSSPAARRAAATASASATSTPTKEKPSDADTSATFEGVPGHKRRGSISVASTKAPTVAPRLNKSAALRAQKDHNPPPTSFKGGAVASPTLSRATSGSLNNTPTRQPTRPASQASGPAPASKAKTPAAPRSSSVLGTSTNDGDGTKARVPPPRPSSAMMAPIIAPRTNKSAALRAAKMEADNAAAAAAAAKKKAPARIAKAPPPSSFKTVAAS